MNDYQPIVYFLARVKNKIHDTHNINNLLTRFFVIGILVALEAIVFEICLDIATKFILFTINLVRIIEYEPKINFEAHGFSVLFLGNLIALILIGVYICGLKTRAFLSNLNQDVSSAQQEIRANEKTNKKEQ